MTQSEKQILKEWKWIENMLAKKIPNGLSKEEMLHFLLTKFRSMHLAFEQLHLDKYQSEAENKIIQKEAISKQKKKSAQEVIIPLKQFYKSL